MKKFLLFITLCILTVVPQAFSEEIDVLPTMESKSNVQDRVWSGTFQMVWNDIIDKYSAGQVRYAGISPEILKDLNRRTFDSYNHPKFCYYKYLGKLKKNTADRIINVGHKRYGISGVLSDFNYGAPQNSLLLYALFNKNFKFNHEFDKLGYSDFRGVTTEFYGINSLSNEYLRNDIEILFYNNENDFAVSIKGQNGDILYLYKTPTTKSFNFIYDDMIKKTAIYKSDKKNSLTFSKNDELKIPYLQFFEEKQFEPLTGERIKGTQIIVGNALQAINFSMANEGKALKEIKHKTTRCNVEKNDDLEELSQTEIKETRLFYFDDTFVVFARNEERAVPYFALRVHNVEKFSR